MSARHRDFPLFDSLRAIAFTCVLLTHASFFAGLQAPGTRLGPFYARLDLGVDIFFVISAFLLYRPFAAAHIDRHAPPRVRAFAWRRVLRIVPPYWLILTVVGLWIGAPVVFRAANIPFFYGFLQIYNPRTVTIAGLPQAWSLCVEMSFYIFLPLYALALRRVGASTRKQRVWIQLAGAAALVVIGVAYNAIIGPPTTTSQMPFHFALPAFIDYFALGIALATLSVAHEASENHPRPLRVLERFPALSWLVALLAFVAVSKWVGLGVIGTHDGYWPSLWRHLLYAVIALGVVLPAVFGDPRRGVVRRILANRFLLYVGTVSYAAYLLEFAVLIQLQRWGFGSVAVSTTPYLWFVVAFLGTVALASVSWFFYERPILRLKGLVSAAPREAAGLEAPALEAPEAVVAGLPTSVR